MPAAERVLGKIRQGRLASCVGIKHARHADALLQLGQIGEKQNAARVQQSRVDANHGTRKRNLPYTLRGQIDGRLFPGGRWSMPLADSALKPEMRVAAQPSARNHLEVSEAAIDQRRF